MASSKETKISAYLDLGLQFAVAVGLGVGVGYFADEKLKTFPLFLLLGLLLGATSGFLNIYRAVFPYKGQKQKEEKKDEE
ncbi:AtpZ/AtpI family protein [candidate division KSB1 bacterium]|nr:AtpZ/AtpI family protein [candidate division KSB1 bacterium]